MATNLFLASLFTASAVIWVTIARRGLVDGSVLPYSVRRPVPWGLGGAFLALLVVVMAISQELAPKALADAPPTLEGAPESMDFLAAMALSALLQLGIVGGGVAWLVIAIGAKPSDLGLPASRRQVVLDLRLGLLTALAAYAPVYLVLFVLEWFLESETIHPTIQDILSNPTPSVFSAAILSAFVAAPIFEEFAFRLLLQGALERIEDEAIVHGARERSRQGLSFDEALQRDSSEKDPGITIETERLSVSWAGLPHGWPPILMSSLAFALAHLGQGAAPVPLFLFALLLGYVYQKTHRLMPCIFAHMTFNGLSLYFAWLTIQTST